MRRYPPRRSRSRRAPFARRFPLSGWSIAFLTALTAIFLVFIFGRSRAGPPDADAVAAFIPASPATTAPSQTTEPEAPVSAPASPATAHTSSDLPPPVGTEESALASVYVSESERYSIAADISLRSPYVYLMHASTGGILLDRGSTERLYPASMTKVMTALVAMELLETREEMVVVGEAMFALLDERRLADAGFVAGEQVSAEDLLYGLLLCSGAECAIALAEHLCGSEAAFAERMNQKAALLGMTDTHFTNTVGYHSEEHYTTLRDTAVMFRYAMSQPWYYQISSARSYTSQPTAEHPQGVTMQNTLFRYAESGPESDVRILAGKTGTTDEAGRCLVSGAVVKGETFICVTAAASGESQPHITDAVAAYNAIVTETVK